MLLQLWGVFPTHNLRMSEESPVTELKIIISTWVPSEFWFKWEGQKLYLIELDRFLVYLQNFYFIYLFEESES